MNYGIFFVHNGEIPRYLFIAMENCRSYNPTVPVYLIGDQCNPKLKQLDVNFLSIDELGSDKEREFVEKYQHVSGNSYDYERFCFLRWFYIDSAIKMLNLTHALHLDSDCILASSIEDLFSEFDEDKDLKCGWKGQPHCLLIKKGLDRLIDYYISAFTDEAIEAWKSEGLGDNYSDMHLLDRYLQKHPERVSVFPENEPGFLEMNMMVPEGYEVWPGKKPLKRVYWEVGNNRLVPNIKKIESGALTRCVALHYKGSAKRYMKKFNAPANAIGALLKLRCILYNKLPPINRLKRT